MSPRHIALGLLVATIWGLNFIVIRLGLDDFPPLLYAALRYAAAAPFVLLVPRPPVSWGRLLLIGMFLGVGSFGLLFAGINLGVPAGLASLLMQAQMPLTVALAALLFHEHPRPRQIGGIVVALLGGILIGWDFDRAGNLAALLAVVGAATSWAVANLILKRTPGANMLHLMVWMSLVPPLPLIGLSLALEGPDAVGAALSGLDASGIGAVLYNALLANVVGFGLWAVLLSRYPAAAVAPFSLLVPVVGMAAAALFLAEPMPPLRLAASGLVLAGLALVVWPGRRPVEVTPAG